MKKAVLFDLDGVLIDSYEASYRTLLNVLSKMRVTPPEKSVFLKKAGLPFQAWIKAFLPRSDEDKNYVVDDASTYAYQKYSSFFLPILGKTMQGASESLVKFKALDFKLGIVTNNSKEIASVLLSRKELQGFFDVVVTSSDVSKPKPDAEPLLKAVELLGLKKEDVLFVGDSSVDVSAAKNAGVAFVLLRNDFNKRLKARKTNSFATLLEEITNGKLD